MKFNPEFNLSQLILFLGFVATTIGLFLTIRQMRRGAKVQRLDFLFRITNDLFTNSDFREFFYKIDYEQFTFDVARIDDFKHSPAERHLDALLYRYDLLARLVRSRVLNVSDIEFVAFEVVQVLKNVHVRKYLSWLELEFSKHSPIKTRPHDDAQWLYEKLVGVKVTAGMAVSL